MTDRYPRPAAVGPLADGEGGFPGSKIPLDHLDARESRLFDQVPHFLARVERINRRGEILKCLPVLRPEAQYQPAALLQDAADFTQVLLRHRPEIDGVNRVDLGEMAGGVWKLFAVDNFQLDPPFRNQSSISLSGNLDHPRRGVDAGHKAVVGELSRRNDRPTMTEANLQNRVPRLQLEEFERHGVFRGGFPTHYLGGWGLLIALPLAALLTGCATLLRNWSGEAQLRQAAWQTLALIRAHLATLWIAGATLTAGGILAIIALHMLTD